MQQSQLEKAFKEKLSEHFSTQFEKFLEEKGIPKKYVPYNIIEKIIQKEYVFVDDFIIEKKAIATEENYNDIIIEFISENYDSEYILMKLEEAFDVEGIAEVLKMGLISQLIRREPYSRVSRSFWEAKVRTLTDFKEITKYAEGDNLGEFVEIYAPEWKEQEED